MALLVKSPNRRINSSRRLHFPVSIGIECVSSADSPLTPSNFRYAGFWLGAVVTLAVPLRHVPSAGPEHGDIDLDGLGAAVLAVLPDEFDPPFPPPLLLSACAEIGSAKANATIRMDDSRMIVPPWFGRVSTNPPQRSNSPTASQWLLMFENYLGLAGRLAWVRLLSLRGVTPSRSMGGPCGTIPHTFTGARTHTAPASSRFTGARSRCAGSTSSRFTRARSRSAGPTSSRFTGARALCQVGGV